MDWPYHFTKLSSEETHQQRLLLDRYGVYAQLSALVPIVVLLLLRLTRWAFESANKRRVYQKTLGSNSRAAKAFISDWSTTMRKVSWWLGSDVHVGGQSLGRRDQWIFGWIWALWLFFLCICQTGDNYFHVTRRFGMVGVSQLPLLYVLASKNLNPFRYISRTSHEEVIPWHQVLGYTTYSLIGCHAVLYLNKYYQTGELLHAVFRLVPLLGITGFLAMTLLTTTTLGVVRRFSYRMFYGAHIFAITTTPVIVWFHVPHGRSFAVESLLILLAESIARSASTVVSPASITCITGTDLMKLVIEVPRETLKYYAQYPSLHSYITLRDGSWRTQGWKYIFSLGLGLPWNPFTIAAVDVGASEITVIVRRREGPLTRKLASISQEATKTVIGIRGPYGAAAFFPDFKPARFDRILLVAGGVGITFIMPIFKHTRAMNPSVEVELVWSVRDFNESACLTAEELKELQQVDQHVGIYVTGSDTKARKILHDGVEPADRSEPVSDSKDFQQGTSNLVCRFQRPDLSSLVDGLFESGYDERVAVVCCGPIAMSQSLRSATGAWVAMDRQVWFHAESFDW
ncbi:hypothetical protein CERZMDRAFT_103509 [Cercospora zeae-maydis SCOH1-5]|uniref:FAD-binding FR-type domain-containing protein n=1 Tax=Cercospora zeae-maydis SCOH1-5 TaxID=717836 RepID=A0A6A6EYQ5_9PEZI|nr:hypothetical protein CERZMDRAFT_103509 [Cercospora zeae-maydis SCOH1-5]